MNQLCSNPTDTAGTQLRLHAFVPRSCANGPGWRAVIWTQGCSIRCPGCFNPETHDPTGGELVAIDALFSRIAELGETIEGITISGGEPLDQPLPLAMLLKKLRSASSLSVVLFTGYTRATLSALPHVPDILACVDVLIAGAYKPQSSNAGNDSTGDWKSVLFLTKRYNAADMHAGPDAEAVIMPDGSLVFSGLHPPALHSATAVQIECGSRFHPANAAAGLVSVFGFHSQKLTHRSSRRWRNSKQPITDHQVCPCVPFSLRGYIFRLCALHINTFCVFFVSSCLRGVYFLCRCANFSNFKHP
jgi:anaerobic ribonucleoside-triphosphate reductase activating protein